MTPEQKQEESEYRAKKAALQTRIQQGSISGEEATAQKKELSEWYDKFTDRVIGRKLSDNGSV